MVPLGLLNGFEVGGPGGPQRGKEGEANWGLFFIFYFYHVFVVKYKKQHGALAMAETKL